MRFTGTRKENPSEDAVMNWYPKAQARPTDELSFNDSELVIGLVAATGTDLGGVTQVLKERNRRPPCLRKPNK